MQLELDFRPPDFQRALCQRLIQTRYIDGKPAAAHPPKHVKIPKRVYAIRNRSFNKIIAKTLAVNY